MLNQKSAIIGAVLLALAAFWFFTNHNPQLQDIQPVKPIPIITSSAFANKGPIPTKYTCDGDDLNPPLKIANLLPKAKSLSLIVSDPDASIGTFYHWLVFNIDPSIKEIKENHNFTNAVSLKNDFGKPQYNGPCPPKGQKHRYFFTLYALDRVLNANQIKTKQDLVKAVQTFSLGYSQIIGTYQR